MKSFSFLVTLAFLFYSSLSYGLVFSSFNPIFGICKTLTVTRLCVIEKDFHYLGLINEVLKDKAKKRIVNQRIVEVIRRVAQEGFISSF